MSDFKVVHNNIWKRPTVVSVKDASTWKPVRTIYVNDSGVWKPVWTAPGSAIVIADVGSVFTVPAGVFSICVAAISEGISGSSGGTYTYQGGGYGGNGGDGGSLAYKNNIPVNPGDTFSISNLYSRVNFGSRYVLNGRAGVSSGWDTYFLGGQGGLGQAAVPYQNMGSPGGEGGFAATWISSGRNGGNAPGGASAAYGGQGTDVYGVVRSYGTGNGAGSGVVAVPGSSGSSYGGGGGGGSGQIYAGDGPFAGGVGSPGVVRIIWGTGKSFPDAANFL